MELLERLQTTLGDSYRVERELKAGGMARVFVATDTTLGRPVVVKVLSPELAEGVSSRRFAREIRLAASLQHTNIVPVLSAAEASGMPHYMMPLVDGPSLRDRLQEPTPIPLVEAIGILRDVARALAYAHERGVVHRDIKPDNILLSGGAAMVTDALRVRHVLYGTIWPEGGVFRVRAHLSRSDDGQPLWQDEFDGDAQRFLASLDSITEGISSAVQRALVGPDSAVPRVEPGPRSMRGTADTAAYERFLRAQALLRAGLIGTAKRLVDVIILMHDAEVGAEEQCKGRRLKAEERGKPIRAALLSRYHSSGDLGHNRRRWTT